MATESKLFVEPVVKHCLGYGLNFNDTVFAQDVAEKGLWAPAKAKEVSGSMVSLEWLGPTIATGIERCAVGSVARAKLLLSGRLPILLLIGYEPHKCTFLHHEEEDLIAVMMIDGTTRNSIPISDVRIEAHVVQKHCMSLYTAGVPYMLDFSCPVTLEGLQRFDNAIFLTTGLDRQFEGFLHTMLKILGGAVTGTIESLLQKSPSEAYNGNVARRARYVIAPDPLPHIKYALAATNKDCVCLHKNYFVDLIKSHGRQTNLDICLDNYVIAYPSLLKNQLLGCKIALVGKFNDPLQSLQIVLERLGAEAGWFSSIESYILRGTRHYDIILVDLKAMSETDQTDMKFRIAKGDVDVSILTLNWLYDSITTGNIMHVSGYIAFKESRDRLAMSNDSHYYLNRPVQSAWNELGTIYHSEEWKIHG